MADAREPKLDEDAEAREAAAGDRVPRRARHKPDAVDDRAEADEVERDRGRDRCADEPQADRLGAPDCQFELECGFRLRFWIGVCRKM